MKNTVFEDAVKRFEKSEHFRVVAFGASNTERYMPCVHWVDVLEVGLRARFGRKFHMIDSGVSGNNTVEALERFERDVAFFKPDLVIVTLGGNDCNPAPPKHVPEADYVRNLNTIADRIEKLGALVVFQTYYAMDLEAMEPERAKSFMRNMQLVREVAAKRDIHLVDQLALFETVQKMDYATFRYKLMINSMHTNEEGNLLMGVELLRHFDIDPMAIAHYQKLLPAMDLHRTTQKSR